MAEQPVKQRVSTDRIRTLYAEHFEERVTSGTYPLRERLRTHRRFIDLPAGTASVVYDILSEPEGSRTGVVHAVVLPDGTVGASGRYDPKALEVGGILYIRDPRIAD